MLNFHTPLVRKRLSLLARQIRGACEHAWAVLWGRELVAARTPARNRHYGAAALMLGALLFAMWGISVAASSSPMSVTDYTVTPAEVGVGGTSTLKATLRSAKNVKPAYTLLTVPPHSSLVTAPADCISGTYDVLQGQGKALPSKTEMIGQGLLAGEVDSSTLLYCERLELPEGTAWTVEFKVKGDSVGKRRSFAFAAAGDPLDGGWASEITQNELSVVQTVDLGVTKTASPSPVNAGETVTYTMVVSNLSTVDAPAVTLIDALPAADSLEVTRPLPSGCSLSDTTMTCDVGALAAGASKTISVKGRVLQSRGTQTNGVTVALGKGVSGVTEVDLSNNQASAVVAVTPVIKLAASKTMAAAEGSTIIAGQAVSMKLGAQNTGVMTANDVIVTDTVPAHFTDVMTSDSRCTLGAYNATTGTPVRCTVGTLTKGQDQSGLFAFTMLATQTQTALSGTNTATINATQPGDVQQLLLTPASVNYTIQPSQPKLGVGKAKKVWVRAQLDDPTSATLRDDVPAKWDDALQSRIEVRNATNATAVLSKLDDNGRPRVIMVTDVLGAYEQYTGAAGAGWTCLAPTGAVSQMVTCSHTLEQDLAIGAVLPALLINSKAVGSGQQKIENIATVTAEGLGSATVSATVQGVPATAKLGLGKSGTLHQPDPSDPSKDTLVYLLTVKNDGPDAATGIQVVDALPMWFKPTTGAATKVTVDLAAAPAQTTCTSQATTSNVVECTLGNLPNGSTATIKITVGRPFNVNNLTNTFTVSSVDTQVPNQAAPSPGGGGGLSPTALADVTVSQVLPPSVPMQVGVPATFRTDFANLGANAAQGVKVQQSVNLDLMDVKSMSLSQNGAGTCAVVRGTPLSNSSVECTLSRPLAPNEALQMSVELTPKFGGAYDNLALDKSCAMPTSRMARAALVRDQCADAPVTSTITTSTKQSDIANDTGAATAKVKKESVDLTIAIEDNYAGLVQDPSPLNETVQYELTVGNNGPSVATDVSFYLKGTPPAETGFSMDSVSFPAGLSCTAVTPAGGEWTWKCALTDGVLQANEIKKFILPFKVAALDTVAENLSGFKTYALSGKVFSSETGVGETAEGGIASDTNQGNNQTNQKTVVVPRAQLAVVKSVNPQAVAIHEPFAYTIAVSNNGPSAAAKVVVTDTLDANLELQPEQSASSTLAGVCKLTGLALRCEVPLLKKGETATVTVPVRVKLGYTGTTLMNGAQAGPTIDGEGTPSFFPKEPATSTVVNVGVQPSSLTGKVVVAPDGTDLSTTPDVSKWPAVPDSAVSVTLKGKDPWGNDVEITLPKKSGGTFTFEGLPPSGPAGYTITQTQPGGYLDYKDLTPTGTPPAGYVAEGATESITGVTVVANEKVQGIVFAEVKLGSISGFTYLDVNDSKTRSVGDLALSSVQVTLSGTDYTGKAVALGLNQLTASAGGYTFDKLPPGNYAVSVTLIASATYIGASVDQTVQANPVDVKISGITVASGGAKTEHNFGFKNNGTVTNTLQGRVYVDLNKNGSWDDGEPGIAGVKVQLSGKIQLSPGDSGSSDICARLGASCEATTDAQGKYVFPHLLESDAAGYTVTEVASSAPLKLYADGAEKAQGSTATVGNDQFTKVVLNPTSQHTSLDFGEQLFSLAGRVEVLSLNATLQKPLADVVVRIEGTTGAAGALCAAGNYAFPVSHPCEVKTDSLGHYVFPDLPAGTYTVTEAQPAGYGNHANLIGTAAGSASNRPDGSASLFSNVQLLASATLSDKIDAKDYVFQEAGNALTGWVYIDADNNGDRSPTEPGIGGVTVTITEKTTGETYTTTTQPDGSYQFTSLPNGNYTLTETQPSGYLDGAEKPGGTGGAPVGTACTAKDCNTIDNIQLDGGKTYENYLFAEVGATVSGKVYEEKRDPATGASTMGPGLEGVEIKLVNKSGDPAWCAARADQCVTKTRADGSYAFEGVPPGSYEVVKNQNQLAAYYATKGKAYTDGIETAGVGGGTVENRYFGTQLGYNTIGGIEVTPEKIAAHSGKLDGYLFGVRQGAGAQGLIYPVVNGYVYMDHSHNRVRDPVNTDGQAGWTVVLSTSTGQEICTVQTNAQGFYQFDNLHCTGHEAGLPTSDRLPGNPTFNVHFSKDGNVLPNLTSSGDNVGAAGGGQITGLVLRSTDQIVEQNLPLDPEGVVYDAVTRKPVAGAVIGISFTGAGLFDPSTHLVGGASFQNQTTGTDGRYSFILQNNYPNGEYVLTIQSAPPAYLPGPSVMIPACVNTLNVALLPGGLPALMQAQRNAPGLAQTLHDPQACPATPAGFANAAPFSLQQQSTQYYLRFAINRGASSEILNNHIPVDPVLAGGALLVTKTTPKVNVAKGDLVPYSITATNMSGGALANVRVRDMLPPGFRYRKGSATWNKLPVEPEVNGRELTWPNQNFATNEKKSYQLLLTVGAGVGEGEYVNQAWAINSLVSERISNVANAAVRVVPDPTFDCSDLIGKVFDDQNVNGYQDQGEPGIPNVRVVTARGLLVTTDADGRFHVACAAIPQADRGSNFVMKLDERTLPSGYRMTTENPRDVRVTRGKMVKLNFGAAVHKVLRLEVDSRAFAQDGKLSAQWDSQVEQLLAQLAERPTVLRIAYRMTGEGQDVAAQRLKALTRHIHDGYAQRAQQHKKQEDDTPPLVIETESFEQNKAQGVR